MIYYLLCEVSPHIIDNISYKNKKLKYFFQYGSIRIRLIIMTTYSNKTINATVWGKPPVISNKTIVTEKKERQHINRNINWPFKPFSKFDGFTEDEGWFSFDKNYYNDICNKYNYINEYPVDEIERKTIRETSINQRKNGIPFEKSIRFLIFGKHKTSFDSYKDDECANCGIKYNDIQNKHSDSCFFGGAKTTDKKCICPFHITNEHIHPVFFGGSNDEKNKCITCKKCNDDKGNKYRIDNFDISKVNPKFVNQLNNYKIDYKNMDVHELMHLLRRIVELYLVKCKDIFNKL